MSCRLQRASAAADYYLSRRVPERLEEALNRIYHRGPEDVYGHLSNYFAEFSDPPVVSDVRGRKVLDGAGKATVEAEVVCRVRTVHKRMCGAVASVDSDHAAPLTSEEDEDAERRRRESVQTAIGWIQDSIGPSLRGMEPTEQSAIDRLLSDYFRAKKQEDKECREAESEKAPSPTVSVPSPAPSPPASKKKTSAKGKKVAVSEKPIPPAEPPDPAIRGALALSAVSLAVAKSSAALRDIPLHSHIAALQQQQPPPELAIPTPLISLLSCGKSSPGKLNLMKEIMVIPKPGTATAQSLDLISSLQTLILKQMEAQSKGGQSVMKSVSPLGCLVLACERLDQPLELIRDACEQLGLELGTDVYLAINCAAHELMDYNKGRYEVTSGTWKSPDEMVELYVDLIKRHAAIVALLDPFRKEDKQQWEALGKAVGSRCYLMADVASGSVVGLLQGSNAPVCSGPILKLTNETTVSDLLAAVRLIEGEKRLTVLGGTSEESAEDGIVDLAVGLGVKFIKLGGLLRGERTAKYNRLLAIEEDLIRSGTLGRQEEFKFPTFWNDQEILNQKEESI
ncbi:enolase 4 [Hyla sarda]|uniref:enolase 4 n=1 Tax=Hyla sarda TaxID=327740 RepID=UPI0024C340BF|nr:enolase 4 [Hyla sarda]